MGELRSIGAVRCCSGGTRLILAMCDVRCAIDCVDRFKRAREWYEREERVLRARRMREREKSTPYEMRDARWACLSLSGLSMGLETLRKKMEKSENGK